MGFGCDEWYLFLLGPQHYSWKINFLFSETDFESLVEAHEVITVVVRQSIFRLLISYIYFHTPEL